MPKVVAVVHAIRTDDHEEHIRHLAGDAVGKANEDIESAHGLEPTGHERDDPHVVANRLACDSSWHLPALPEIDVDTVVDRLDLRLPGRWREAPLPSRG